MPNLSTSSRVTAAAAAIAAMMATAVIAQQQPALDPGQLTLNGVDASRVTYRGRDAVRLVERDGPAAAAATATASSGMAVLRGVTLMDGTIELQVAGAPRTGAAEGARGFVGVSFRLSPDGSSFENIYLRPTNGRTDDQVRRNHSVQYASEPDFPWPRLRKEFPEKYESYVDLEPGAWTRMRIVVRGTTARLYVHDAEQPALVVNDLKIAPRDGGVALWVGPGTEGYFADLKITR